MDEAARRHYRFESYCLDTQTRELRAGDGAAVALTAKAFETLRLLIENRHRVVGKDELLATVWAGRVVEENNLTQAVSALRRALGAGAGDHRYIVTVPGRGYQFVAQLHEADRGDVAGSAASGSAPVSAAWRRTIALGALLFMLALFAMAAWRLRETPLAPLAAAQTSLAVLPFRSLSAGPRDELLELGMAETLSTRLERSRANPIPWWSGASSVPPTWSKARPSASATRCGSARACSPSPAASRCGRTPSTPASARCSPCRTRSATR